MKSRVMWEESMSFRKRVGIENPASKRQEVEGYSVLTELVRIRTRQQLLAVEFDMLRVDVTQMPLEQRKEVLNQWFSYHLRCVDGNGHRWASHHWLSGVNAWLWGPCMKCGASRLVQTRGNMIVWHQSGRHAEALIMNKDFAKIEMQLAEIWRHVY